MTTLSENIGTILKENNLSYEQSESKNFHEYYDFLQKKFSQLTGNVKKAAKKVIDNYKKIHS